MNCFNADPKLRKGGFYILLLIKIMIYLAIYPYEHHGAMWDLDDDTYRMIINSNGI